MRASEAALPLGWQVSGLYRFGELWIGLAEGPTFDDYASGSGQYAEQALRRPSKRCAGRAIGCGSGGGRRQGRARVPATMGLLPLVLPA